MKKRNIFLVALFAVITLGIYGIYWLYATRRELVGQTGNPKDIPPVIIMFLPIIVLVATWIYSFTTAPSDNSIYAQLTGASLLILVAVTIILPLWWFFRYFKILHQVTQGTDFAVMYILWVAMAFAGIWPAIMIIAQNDLNNYIDKHGISPDPVAPQPFPSASQAPKPPTAL